MIDTILNFFISNAHAVETAPTPAPQGGGMSLLMMLGIFVFFLYFTVWRPQSKRAREQQNLLQSLTKGDEVLTAGGLLGRISKLSDQFVFLSIANEVEIVVQKSAITRALPKGTLKSIE